MGCAILGGDDSLSICNLKVYGADALGAFRRSASDRVLTSAVPRTIWIRLAIPNPAEYILRGPFPEETL